MPAPSISEIRITATYEALVQLAKDLRFMGDDEKRALRVKELLAITLLATLPGSNQANLVWTLIEPSSRVMYGLSIVIVQEPRFAYPAGEKIEGLRSSDDICDTWCRMLKVDLKSRGGAHFTPHKLQAHLQFTSVDSGTQPVLRTIQP